MPEQRRSVADDEARGDAAPARELPCPRCVRPLVERTPGVWLCLHCSNQPLRCPRCDDLLRQRPGLFDPYIGHEFFYCARRAQHHADLLDGSSPTCPVCDAAFTGIVVASRLYWWCRTCTPSQRCPGCDRKWLENHVVRANGQVRIEFHCPM